MNLNIKKSATCSSCGSNLEYDPESGNLKCCHCETYVKINNDKEIGFINVSNFSKLTSGTISVSEQNDFKSVCPKCGATQKFSTSLINTKCDYCGSTITTQLLTRMKDENCGIVPFAISKKKAKQILKEWIKKSSFTPNNLSTQIKPNKLNGSYFPSYIFNIDATVTYLGVGVKINRTTVTKKDSSGKLYTTHEESKTTHPFSGVKNFSFRNEYVRAVKKLNDNEFEKLEFPTLDAKQQFKPEYVYGLKLESADVEFRDCLTKIENKTKNNMETKIKNSLGYDEYESFKISVNFTQEEVKEVYLPIWDGQIVYKENLYPFSVNGKTGKIKGKLPKSFGKIFGLIAGILSVGAVIGLLVYFLT